MLLPGNVRIAITVARAEPPLESAALLILRGRVKLCGLRRALVVLRLGLVDISHRVDGHLPRCI